MIDNLPPEIRYPIQQHLQTAFPNGRKELFEFMDWLYRSEVGSQYTDAAGGVWKKSLTPQKFLLLALYQGRYVGKEIYCPRGVRMSIIEQDPDKLKEAEKWGTRPSKGARMLKYGYDVAQITVNSKYVGMLYAKGNYGHPLAECCMDVYKQSNRGYGRSAS